MSLEMFASWCGAGVVVLGLAGCSQDTSSEAGPADENDLTKAAISAFECTVSKGVDEHDDVAKFSFKASGLGTADGAPVRDRQIGAAPRGARLRDADVVDVIAVEVALREGRLEGQRQVGPRARERR